MPFRGHTVKDFKFGPHVNFGLVEKVQFMVKTPCRAVIKLHFSQKARLANSILSILRS